MSIRDNLREILSTLPPDVTLVAVSKTFPVSSVREAHEAGQRNFGENRVQELIEKQPELPGDILWHQIGHLQTNKVKYIAPFIHLIHAVDSEKLLREIDKQAQKQGRKINVLLQIHIADEEQKFGMDFQEAEQLIRGGAGKEYPGVVITGLMGMATNTDDSEKVRAEFRGLRSFFEKMQAIKKEITTLSMGMSGDYKIAVEEGSTMVRIGSSIFGKR